jgi:hypothetical protein
MKIPALFIALTIACSAQDDASIVRFVNGDQLSGNVQSLSKETLSWESSILKEPAEFGLTHVLDLTLPASLPEGAGEGIGHEAVLEMTNGDSIRGKLSGIADEEIRLNTWYAGELVFRRVIVKSVTISGSSDYVYRGPKDLKEWTPGRDRGGWTFRNGALYTATPGGIAREIQFPEEFSISFDAAWRNSFRPKIIFLSDDIRSDSPKSGYEMVFQGNSVYLKKGGASGYLGQAANIPQLRENEKAKIEIRCSKKSGKIVLYVDGEFVDIWEDSDMDVEKSGKGFHIISQDAAPLKISNIAVSTWDGYVEDLPKLQDAFQGRDFRNGLDFEDGSSKPNAATDDTPPGRMILRNGDTIEGEVLGIKEDNITLKTPFTEITFPIERLKNVVLSKADMETPRLNNGDVRATLADGSRLVFRLDGVEDDTLLGFSQNFGEARFSRAAFTRIEFNIHNRELAAQRNRDDW